MYFNTMSEYNYLNLLKNRKLRSRCDEFTEIRIYSTVVINIKHIYNLYYAKHDLTVHITA